MNNKLMNINLTNEEVFKAVTEYLEKRNIKIDSNACCQQWDSISEKWEEITWIKVLYVSFPEPIPDKGPYRT